VTEEQNEEYLRRHDRIIDAIAERNLEKAKSAMSAHLDDLAGRARRATDELRQRAAGRMDDRSSQSAVDSGR